MEKRKYTNSISIEEKHKMTDWFNKVIIEQRISTLQLSLALGIHSEYVYNIKNKSRANLFTNKTYWILKEWKDSGQSLSEYVADKSLMVKEEGMGINNIKNPYKNILCLLRETVMRSNIAFPENEIDQKWFDEGIKIPMQDNFLPTLFEALDLGHRGGIPVYFPEKGKNR